MTQTCRNRLTTFLAAASLALGCLPSPADYKDDVGFTALQNLLGPLTPTGAGVDVTQVEAMEAPGKYFPDPGDAEFVGKTIVDQSEAGSGASEHATIVGRYLYGSTTGIAPGQNPVDAYWQDDWLNNGSLRTGSQFAPRTESRDVQNHSWIALDEPEATNTTRRFDYAIRRDGFTAVVGLGNLRTNPVPLLMAQSYNAISVGRSDNRHSRWGTTFDEPGRVKPELVAPIGATSHTTALVGGAAALLLETARGVPAWTDAARPEAVKALLMAGATKDEFASWDRTPWRPLDEIFGAGELNVLNSYLILTNGPQAEGPGHVVAPWGWATGTQSAGETNRFFLEAPPGRVISDLSVMLVWNRHILDEPGGGFHPVPEVPDLSLRLRTAAGYTPGTVIDLSTSTVDNVEHVYQPEALPPGRCVFEVTGDVETEYALAWRSSTQVHVPRLLALVVETGGTARVTVEGTADQPYDLEYAEQPALNWTPIVTNTPTAAPFELLDPGAGSATNRVYRVQALGVP